MASVLIAAVVSAAWCLLAIWLGRKLGYVDAPGRSDLTAHIKPAVPLGGVGIFLAIHLSALWRGHVDVPLLVGSSVVLVLGLFDDRLDLSPIVRLIVEIAAAVSLVVLAGYPAGGPLFGVLAVFVIVMAINAVNLYDGLDGLAGLSTLIAALGLAWLFAGRGLESLPPLELAAALGGFLLLNWHPAKVFLGDSGSYLVGLALAHGMLSSGDSTGEVIVAMGLFGVFAIDLVASVARRLLSGARLFEGDRSHLYDQLRDRGLSVPAVALISGSAEAILVGAVVLVDRFVTPWAGVVILMVLMVAVMGGLARAGFLNVKTR
ncbi:MAG: MraY family glycosyltransferase [Acidimicrobiia bacterium]